MIKAMPHVSPQTVQAVSDVVDLFPQDVVTKLEQKGLEVLVSQKISEAYNGLQRVAMKAAFTVHSVLNLSSPKALAFYDRNNRDVVVSEEYDPHVREPMKKAYDVRFTTAHEISHAIDDLIPEKMGMGAILSNPNTLISFARPASLILASNFIGSLLPKSPFITSALVFYASFQIIEMAQIYKEGHRYSNSREFIKAFKKDSKEYLAREDAVEFLKKRPCMCDPCECFAEVLAALHIVDSVYGANVLDAFPRVKAYFETNLSHLL